MGSVVINAAAIDAQRAVRSGWAPVPVSVSGTFQPNEWTGAGVLAVLGGYMMVKNDLDFLYIALDLVADNGNSAGVGDYFWLSFDNDGNRAITPNVDVDYGIYPALPVRIGRQFYLGPGVWTTLLAEPTKSAAAMGFAATMHSAAPHRIWEMKLDLKEIGVSRSALASHPMIGFGLRVSSTTPAFTYDYPAGFYADFSGLPQIVLADGPHDPYGTAAGDRPSAGVGLIPATNITGGRATIAVSWHVENAAFCGTMNIVGNRATLGNLFGGPDQARKYRMLHRTGGGAWEPIQQSWVNYRYNGATYVAETYAPDANQMYPMLDPAQDYSVDDLLLEWKSGGFANGLHDFKVEFFKQDNTPVAAPDQVMTLLLDNNQPSLRFLNVSCKGVMASPCDIIGVDESAEPVKIDVCAYDYEGDLYSYALNAYYGAGQVFPIGSASYPGGDWKGELQHEFVASISPKFPPQTCAYELRLSAWPRTTNGHGYVGYAEATTHLDVPPSGVRQPRWQSKLPRAICLGMPSGGVKVMPGTTPTKLGS